MAATKKTRARTQAAPRSGEGAPRATALALEWRAWIAENLARGASEEQLVTALRGQGVPPREARARVRELARSPALAVAQQWRRRALRYELALRLQRVAARSVAQPGCLERVAAPSSDEFFTRYYATNTPVVLTDVVPRWPAFTRWSPAHFAERYGAVEVQMTDGREADPDYDLRRERHFATTTMRAFVERVLAAGRSNDFYLIARNYNLQRTELAPLLDDIDWSSGYFDRPLAARSTALWFGPEGTVTPLHHDTSSIFFAQVYGTKTVLLAAPAEVSLFEGMRAMYAALDPELPAAERRPEHVDVLLYEARLAPGEALFIPAGWWHHVRATSVSISVAINGFAQRNAFDWYHPGRV